jgi:DNA polymerase (family 10)
MVRLTPPPPRGRLPANDEIAEVLERVAALLEGQEENPFRVQAYRTAAETIRARLEPVAELSVSGGTDALQQLAGVGPRIARHIDTFVHSGRVPLLEQLEGDASPERLLASVPGIGPKSAREIHLRLGISRLEDLEAAAHDGRLQRIPGFGPRRLMGLRYTLGHMLSRGRRHARQLSAEALRPPVGEVLAVDAEYRRQAQAGQLPTIAPRRFNPAREAWLPILHRDRGGWHYMAAYSNTARAHQFQRQRDWVVIYYDHDDVSGQYTVVTEGSGPLRGRRVVRGREAECREFYDVGPESPRGPRPAPPAP